MCPVIIIASSDFLMVWSDHITQVWTIRYKHVGEVAGKAFEDLAGMYLLSFALFPFLWPRMEIQVLEAEQAPCDHEEENYTSHVFLH